MTRVCKFCNKETKEKDMAYKYTNAKYCRCRDCTRKQLKETNHKYKQERGLTYADTEKWKVGKTYNVRGLNVRTKQALFLDGILALEDKAIKINYDYDKHVKPTEDNFYNLCQEIKDMCYYE